MIFSLSSGKFNQSEHAIPTIPALELLWETSRLRFKASLGYIEKSCLKIKVFQT